MPYKDVEKRRQRANERNKLKREGNWEPKPPRRLGKNLICPQCGKEFYRKLSMMRNGNNYCSQDCMGKAFNGRMVKEKSPRWKGEETRPCENCGEMVTRQKWAWLVNKMTFCNHRCFGQWKAKSWTGNDNPSWAGGHPLYYGANWKRQQREARRRDNHQCQLCNTSEFECRRALDVHHIIPFRFFGIEQYKKANALSNLVSLCDKCHKRAEYISRDGTVTDWNTLRRRLTPDCIQEDRTKILVREMK